MRTIDSTPGGPKPYVVTTPRLWWLESPGFIKFVARELTCIAVGYFALLTMCQMSALISGPEAYQALQDWLKTPLAIVLTLLSLGAVLFHTVSWFNVTPRAVVVRMGGKRLPDAAIIAPNYVAWIVISGIVAWIVLGA